MSEFAVCLVDLAILSSEEAAHASHPPVPGSVPHSWGSRRQVPDQAPKGRFAARRSRLAFDLVSDKGFDLLCARRIDRLHFERVSKLMQNCPRHMTLLVNIEVDRAFDGWSVDLCLTFCKVLDRSFTSERGQDTVAIPRNPQHRESVCLIGSDVAINDVGGEMDELVVVRWLGHVRWAHLRCKNYERG